MANPFDPIPDALVNATLLKVHRGLKLVCLALPHLSGVAAEIRLHVDRRVGTAAVSRSGRVLVNPEFFADLESPVTRLAAVILDDVLKRYPSQLRLQFRNFPLSFHAQAALAHEAAMTAAREGRFWEFANYVLDHQDALREQDLIALAGRLGLDTGDEDVILLDVGPAFFIDPKITFAAEDVIEARGSHVTFTNHKPGMLVIWLKLVSAGSP